MSRSGGRARHGASRGARTGRADDEAPLVQRVVTVASPYRRYGYRRSDGTLSSSMLEAKMRVCQA